MEKVNERIRVEWYDNHEKQIRAKSCTICIRDFDLKKKSYLFVICIRVKNKDSCRLVVSELTKMLQWRAVTYVVSSNGGLGQTVTARPVTVT